jgi:hypothetical protein
MRVWTPNPAILLHPNVPKPLHGTAPRVILGAAWWDRERRECYKITNFHCIACGVHKSDAKYHKWLEAHETYEIDYHKGTAKYLGSNPLCHFCHNFIHDGRLQALLDQGKLHHDKFVKIIQHGEAVLAKAGLSRPSHAEREAQVQQLITNGKIAEWSSWRLQIGRKKYPGKFPTMEDWIKHYSREDE